MTATLTNHFVSKGSKQSNECTTANLWKPGHE